MRSRALPHACITCDTVELGDLELDYAGRDLERFVVGCDVRLFTLVSGFFAKLGFVESAARPPALAREAIYECASCEPARCRTMVRRPDAT